MPILWVSITSCRPSVMLCHDLELSACFTPPSTAHSSGAGTGSCSLFFPWGQHVYREHMSWEAARDVLLQEDPPVPPLTQPYTSYITSWGLLLRDSPSGTLEIPGSLGPPLSPLLGGAPACGISLQGGNCKSAALVPVPGG